MFPELDAHADDLTKFVEAYMDAAGPAEAAMESLVDKDTEGSLSESWEELKESLARAKRIVRITACLLCVDLDPSDGPTSSDVLWMLNSTITHLPEKTIKECLQTVPELVRVGTEIVKTSANSTKLLPEMDRVRETLTSLKSQSLPWCAERIESLTGSLEQLQCGLRAKQMKSLNDFALELFTSRAQDIMQVNLVEATGATASGIKSREVAALLRGLQLYANIEGVTDLQKELSKWMTVNMQAMALVDLLDLSELSEKSGVADLQKVSELLPRAKGINDGLKTEETYLRILSLLNSSLHAVIGEVRRMAGSQVI